MNIKERVKGQVKFSHYQDGNLVYKCEDGFEFPVHVSQCGSARFLGEDKGIFFMRWIKKQMEVLEKKDNKSGEE